MFEADENGVSESTPFCTFENTYAWNTIEKIMLTPKYVQKGMVVDGASYNWNIMLIYFNNKTNHNVNFLQRSQKQISISPEGHYFITVQLPKNNLNDIKEKLVSISKNKNYSL